MCGGRRRFCCRSLRGVSPVRTAVRMSTSGSPSRQLRPNTGQRRLEVQADVVGQRPERRDIDDRRLIRQATVRETPHDKIVERGEEGGERLARAGRRGDEGVAACADGRPRGGLGGCGSGEGSGEPGGDGGVESFDVHGFITSGRAQDVEVAARSGQQSSHCAVCTHARQAAALQRLRPSMEIMRLSATRAYRSRSERALSRLCGMHTDPDDQHHRSPEGRRRLPQEAQR